MTDIVLYAILVALGLNGMAILYIFEHFSSLVCSQGDLIDRILERGQSKHQDSQNEVNDSIDLGFDITGNEIIQMGECE